jgi:hypothetical protein
MTAHDGTVAVHRETVGDYRSTVVVCFGTLIAYRSTLAIYRETVVVYRSTVIVYRETVVVYFETIVVRSASIAGAGALCGGCALPPGRGSACGFSGRVCSAQLGVFTLCLPRTGDAGDGTLRALGICGCWRDSHDRDFSSSGPSKVTPSLRDGTGVPTRFWSTAARTGPPER